MLLKAFQIWNSVISSFQCEINAGLAKHKISDIELMPWLLAKIVFQFCSLHRNLYVFRISDISKPNRHAVKFIHSIEKNIAQRILAITSDTWRDLKLVSHNAIFLATSLAIALRRQVVGRLQRVTCPVCNLSYNFLG